MPGVNFCHKPQNDPHIPGNCILVDDGENEGVFRFNYPRNSSWEHNPRTNKKIIYRPITALTASAFQEIDCIIDSLTSKNQGAIIQEDLLASSEDEIQDLILKIITSDIVFNVEIANRLSLLYNLSKEEEPDSISISVDSLRNFYGFLLKNTNLTPPTISLSPDNYIYASWRGKTGQLLSVLFLPDKNVHFVIFKPNPRHSEQKIRISGIATFDVLMETLAPHDLEGWILS